LYGEIKFVIKNARVTVLMPVFNGEKYLKEAIESILSQTFADFEFIIVNDGSKDNTAKILASYLDKRIRIVTNPTNMGLTQSLNRGLLASQSKYIVRMDCDDISLPHRLATQIRFLDANPDIGICGSFMRTVDSNGILRYPIDALAIAAALLFRTPFAHPTVAFRKTAIREMHYDKSFVAEDYELWTRIIPITKAANIPEALVIYRKHSGQLTQYLSGPNRECSVLICLGQLLLFAPELEPSTLEFLAQCIYSQDELNPSQIKTAEKTLLQLKEYNCKNYIFPEKVFNEELSAQLWSICRKGITHGLNTYKIFHSSALTAHSTIPLSHKIRFMAKCFLKYGKNGL